MKNCKQIKKIWKPILLYIICLFCINIVEGQVVLFKTTSQNAYDSVADNNNISNLSFSSDTLLIDTACCYLLHYQYLTATLKNGRIVVKGTATPTVTDSSLFSYFGPSYLEKTYFEVLHSKFRFTANVNFKAINNLEFECCSPYILIEKWENNHWVIARAAVPDLINDRKKKPALMDYNHDGYPDIVEYGKFADIVFFYNTKTKNYDTSIEMKIDPVRVDKDFNIYYNLFKETAGIMVSELYTYTGIVPKTLYYFVISNRDNAPIKLFKTINKEHSVFVKNIWYKNDTEYNEEHFWKRYYKELLGLKKKK